MQVPVRPGQVATGCGAVTLCQQLTQAYNDPGSTIAFAWRSFEMYPLLAQVAGARSVQVPLVPVYVPARSVGVVHKPAAASSGYVCGPLGTGVPVER